MQQQNDEGKTKNDQPQEPGLKGEGSTGVRPFSNGSEAYDWLAKNCERCAKNGPPNAAGEGPCPMETAVSRGFILGTVPTELAIEYGAKNARYREDRDAGFIDMPRECSQFVPIPVCEWVSWAGTRRSRKCDESMVATLHANGRTRAVCKKHLTRYAAEHPERAPVLAVDPSWSTPEVAPAVAVASLS